MSRILKCKKGEGYIDTVVIVLVSMLIIAMALKVYPVFIIKNELNTFANELSRTAQIEGQIGSATAAKANQLKNSMGIDPDIAWSKTGRIQLNEEFMLTVSLEVDIGFFEFGSFPIMLRSRVVGRSEVYHK